VTLVLELFVILSLIWLGVACRHLELIKDQIRAALVSLFKSEDFIFL
jgi:hypothetical protein